MKLRLAKGTWPRLWWGRKPLLERQHDYLEQELEALVAAHGAQGPDGGLQERFLKLVRRLGLHLRLEERWLLTEHSLCGGHRLAHQEIRQLVTRALPPCEQDPAQRMQILMDVQEWFHSHRHGVDAIAYARADAQQKPTKSIRQSSPLLQAHR